MHGRKVKVKLLSCIRLFATPWTAAHQAPPSMGFSRLLVSNWYVNFFVLFWAILIGIYWYLIVVDSNYLNDKWCCAFSQKLSYHQCFFSGEMSLCSWVWSHFSRVWVFATPWTVACQAPLSMGFCRQEHWIGLPCPPPGDLPDPGIKPPSVSCVGRRVLYH